MKLRSQLKAGAVPYFPLTEKQLDDFEKHGCDLSDLFPPYSFEVIPHSVERARRYRQAKHAMGAKLMTDDEIDAMSDDDFDMLMSSLEDDDEEEDNPNMEESTPNSVKPKPETAAPTKVMAKKVEAPKLPEVPRVSYKLYEGGPTVMTKQGASTLKGGSMKRTTSFVGVWRERNKLVSASGRVKELRYGDRVKVNVSYSGEVEVKTVGSEWFLLLPLSASSIYMTEVEEEEDTDAKKLYRSQTMSL